MTRKQKYRVWLGLAISLIAVVIVVKSVDVQEIWSNLSKVSLGTIMSLFALYLLSMGIRAWRWGTIIKQRKQVAFGQVFRGLVYGYMLNQLLPAKMGELARAEYLVRTEKSSRSYILGTIAMERLFDLLVIFLFFVASVIFSASLMKQFKSNLFQVGLFLLIASLAVFAVYNLRWFKRPAQLLPKKPREFVYRVIDNMADSFKVLRDSMLSAKALIMTLMIWALTCISLYIIASELSIMIPSYAYLFLVSAGTFGMVIPSTSANIGVYHAITMGALMLFMVPKEQALSFAIVAHAFDFFPAILLGSILLGSSELKNIVKPTNRVPE